MDQRDCISSYVTPKHYDIELRNLDFATWEYTGTVVIHASITQSCSTICISARELKLQGAQVLTTGEPIHAVDFVYKTDETLEIVFEREFPICAGAQIMFNYKGTVSDTLSGFYRSKYKSVTKQATSVAVDQHGSCHVLATHFQHNYASQAFPCFDVPYLKATFGLSLEIPTDQVALSNMPIKSLRPTREGRHMVTFETSPRMSTYLVAWAVGDFEYIETLTEGKIDGRRIPVRVYTVQGLVNQARLSATVAPKALDVYTDLFGIPYPLPKMDIVVVPEMSISAMENWGLIIATSQGALYDPSQSNDIAKWIVAYSIAHELAHQWFGNLVTLPWWDELWLNEGFATWAGAFAVDRIFPEWDTWTKFNTMFAQPTLESDGLHSTHSVHIRPEAGMQVHQMYDDISYIKACCVIRMIVQLVGIDRFSRGVSNYLKQNMYGSASADTLWSALDEASGMSIRAMAEAWIHSPGHPVVTVKDDRKQNKLVVSQERFLTGGKQKTEEEVIWHVPLWIDDGQPHNQGSMLTQRRQEFYEINLDDYKINSDGVGFYRVNYPHTWLANFRADNPSCTSDFKIGLIGSTRTFAAAGFASTTSFLALLERFRLEENYGVWNQLLQSLLTVKQAFAEDQMAHSCLEAFGRRQVADRVAQLGVDPVEDEDVSTKSLRRLLQLNAVRYMDKKTVDYFAARFQDWADNDTELDTSIRQIAFRAAIYAQPKATFNYFRRRLETTTSQGERDDILNAISRVKDTALRHELLDFSFAISSKEAVTMTELAQVILAMAWESAESRHDLWAYLKSHWDGFLSKVTDVSKQDTYLKICVEAATGQNALADVDSFFKDKDTELWQNTLQKAKEVVMNRIAYRERDLQSLKEWLLNRGYGS